MRFGLIGAGCIGQILARALKKTAGCTLAAVVDVEGDRARAIASSHKTRVFYDHQQMLAAAHVDAVIVSTPPQFHEEMVISALEAGKHVLCEKPLANTVQACRRMVDVSRKAGKILATGFNHRYFPPIQFVKHTLDQHVIGELDHVRAFAGHTGLAEFRAPWEYDKHVIVGGALMDVGIHLIDLTRYLLGEIEEVYGIATCNIWQLDRAEDNGFALLRSPQGKSAILHATWAEWKGYRFHIEAYGDRGMLRASYGPMTSMVIAMDKPGGRRQRTCRLYPMTRIREKLWGWQSTAAETFRQELSDFVRVCAGKPGTIADGFAGLRAVEIAQAIYRSSEEKHAIRLTSPW